MNASRPEADIEYSRGPGASRRARRGSEEPPEAPADGAAGRPWNLVLALTGLGAALLVVAEFTALLHVRSGAYRGPVVDTVTAGAHHSYALIPVALLALGLAVAARVTGNRVALAAIGVLGLVGLGIALLGDLPDARATGLLHTASGGYVAAASKPAIGLYLESLGAVVLLLAAGAGLLLSASGDGSARSRFGRGSARTRRSGS